MRDGRCGRGVQPWEIERGEFVRELGRQGGADWVSGMQLAGDKVSAKAWLEKSRVQAARLGLRDAVLTSSDAIRRLGGSTS